MLFATFSSVLLLHTYVLMPQEGRMPVAATRCTYIPLARRFRIPAHAAYLHPFGAPLPHPCSRGVPTSLWRAASASLLTRRTYIPVGKKKARRGVALK